MRDYLIPLLQFQRFFLPGLLVLLAWAIWRTVWHKDLPVGLALYLGLVIIVDGYLNTGIYLPGLEKGSIRYSEICAMFLFINRPPASADRPRPRGGAVIYLVVFYFALLLLSSLRSDSMLAGIFDFRRLIVPQIVAFLVAMRGLESQVEYRRFFLCLTPLAIIIGLFTFWDVFFDRIWLHSDMLFKPEYFHNRKLGRFGSFFLNPNYLGDFIVLVFPATFIVTIEERKPWVRLYAWMGLLALAFCLVETKSRGPLLAFVIGLLLLVFGPCGGMSKKRRMGLLVIFFLLFTLFMPGFYQHAIERFDSPDEGESILSDTRQMIWHYASRVIGDYPLGGIGLGEEQYQKIMEAYGFQALDNPHNSYLQIAIYAGLPALGAFLLLNGIALVRAARISLQTVAPRDRVLVFGLFVSIACFLVSVNTEPVLFTLNVAPAYWVFFGLLLSLTTEAPSAKTVHDSPARLPREEVVETLASKEAYK